jgi:hypothetical protein
MLAPTQMLRVLLEQAALRQQKAENLDATTLHIRGPRPSQSWGGTIAPDGIAPEGVPNCNCISMLPAGPQRRPESHEAYTRAHASLGRPQLTWQSLAAQRNKSSACHVLPVRRKVHFTEQQSFLAIGAARHNTLLQSSNWSTEAVAHSPSPGRTQTLGAFLLRSILGCARSHPPRPTKSFNPSTKLSPTLHAGHGLAEDDEGGAPAGGNRVIYPK